MRNSLDPNKRGIDLYQNDCDVTSPAKLPINQCTWTESKSNS